MEVKTHYRTGHFVACGRRNAAVKAATTTYRQVDCEACRNEINKHADGGAQWAQKVRGN